MSEELEKLKKYTTVDSIEELRELYEKIKYQFNAVSYSNYKTQKTCIDPRYLFTIENQIKYEKELLDIRTELNKDYNVYNEKISPRMYRIALGEDGDVFEDEDHEIEGALFHIVSKENRLIFNIDLKLRIDLFLNILNKYEDRDIISKTLIYFFERGYNDELTDIIRNKYNKIYLKIRESLWDKYYTNNHNYSSKLVQLTKCVFPEFKERIPQEKRIAFINYYKSGREINDVIRMINLFPELINEIKFKENAFDLDEEFHSYFIDFFILRLRYDDNYDFMGIKKDAPIRNGRNYYGLRELIQYYKDDYKSLNTNDIKGSCQFLFGHNDRRIYRIYNSIVNKEKSINFNEILNLRYFLKELKMTPSLVYNYFDNEDYKKSNTFFMIEESKDSNLGDKLLIDLYGEKRFLNFYKDGLKLYRYDVRYKIDMMRMYNELKKNNDKIELPKKPKHVKEIHDYIAKIYRLMIRENKGYNNNLNQWEISKLNNKIFGDYKLKVVKTDWELIETGEKLKHCVASYVKEVRHKESFVFNLYKEGKLECCVELRSDFSIIQAKGFQNKSLDYHVRKDLEDFLKKYKPNNLVSLFYNTTNIIYQVYAFGYYNIIKPIIVKPFKLIKRLLTIFKLSIK